MSRVYVCPKCKSEAVKRAHRDGLLEWFGGLFSVFPYRCRKCDHRFTRYRKNIDSENKTRPRQKRRREILLYGVCILIFLALLSFIIREPSSHSDGN